MKQDWAAPGNDVGWIMLAAANQNEGLDFSGNLDFELPPTIAI